MAVGPALPISTELMYEDGKRIYTSYYLVVSDDPAENPRVVVNAVGIPIRGAKYVWNGVTDDYSFTRSAKVRLKQGNTDRLHWIVRTVHKPADKDDRQSSGNYDDPLSEPTDWKGFQQQLDEQVTEDQQGVRITNTSEQPLAPIVWPQYRNGVEARFNTAEIYVGLRDDYLGTVNNAAFWGFGIGEVKLVQWDFEAGYYGESRTPFVENYMKFEFDRLNKHKVKKPSYGTVTLEDGAGLTPGDRYKATEEATGRSIEVALDATGKFTTGTPHELEFDLPAQQDFSKLPANVQALPSWMLIDPPP